MATWTSRATLGATNLPVFVTSSGTKIYWGDRIGATRAVGDVYEYNPTGHVVTRIIELAAITDLDSVMGLCWFNGDLYLYNTYNTATPFEKVFKVEKWTGIVNGLTTVDTVATHVNTGGGGCGGRLYVDSDQLVATFIMQQADTGSTCRYSSNGSSWSTATFSTEPHFASGGDVSPFPYASHHPLDIHEKLCTSNTIGACTANATYKWTGSGWTVVTTNGLSYYQGIVGTSKYWSTTGGDNYTTDFISNTNAGGSATKVFQVNMPWHPGIINTGTTTDLYQFDGANWVLFESMGAFTFDSGSDSTVVRLTNGDVFFLGNDSGVSAYRIIQRSEAISSSLCQFYQGINTPTYKSDVPLPGVLPGAMAVSTDGQTVVLGGNVAAAQAVVYAANPWGSWTDMPPPMTTGSAVTSIKYV